MNISTTLPTALSAGPAARTAAPTTAAATSGVISSDFETFLRMLTVQMQNQDPLDPIKAEDYAVQLATFSGVEQQVHTNDLITQMTAQLNLMGMAQMSGWVGMEARAPVAGFFDGAAMTLYPNPAAGADKAELVVRNEDGQVVQRLPADPAADTIAWTGLDDHGDPLPTGLYHFELESSANGGLLATTPVDVYAQVVEARNENGQTVLVTRGGAIVPASLVTGVRDPVAVDPAPVATG